jgi:hypothetical protein
MNDGQSRPALGPPSPVPPLDAPPSVGDPPLEPLPLDALPLEPLDPPPEPLPDDIDAPPPLDDDAPVGVPDPSLPQAAARQTEAHAHTRTAREQARSRMDSIPLGFPQSGIYGFVNLGVGARYPQRRGATMRRDPRVSREQAAYLWVGAPEPRRIGLVCRVCASAPVLRG